MLLIINYNIYNNYSNKIKKKKTIKKTTLKINNNINDIKFTSTTIHLKKKN